MTIVSLMSRERATAVLGVFVGVTVFAFALFAIAEEPVTFPVSELGNCENQESCKTYCDEPANQDACIAYAESRGILKTPTTITEKESGPGGCSSISECRAYCDDDANTNECVAYGKRKGLIPEAQADEIIKRREVLREQAGPGGCTSNTECRSYCDDPTNGEECLAFAESQGLIKKGDADFARRRLKEGKKLEEIVGPGGCKGEGECRAYCDDDAHTDECLTFAEKEGFMSAEEIARIRKINQAEGPGGCRGKACKTYCEEPGHEDECLAFAEREGLIPKEEAERAKKFLKATKEQGGPGGCQGRACESYCQDPAHQEECFAFAKKQGLVSEEEMQMFERGKRIEEKMKEAGGPGGCTDDNSCRTFCGDPVHFEECVAFSAAHGGVDRGEAERMLQTFMNVQQGPPPPEAFGDFRPEEFEGRGSGSFGPEGFGPMGTGPKGFGPPQRPGFGRFGPPGFSEGGEEFGQFKEGKIPPEFEERLRKLESMIDVEKQFRSFQGFDGSAAPYPPGSIGGGEGGFAPGFEGPGGCKTPQGCIEFCKSNPDACGPAMSPGERGEMMPREGSTGRPVPVFDGRPEDGRGGSVDVGGRPPFPSDGGAPRLPGEGIFYERRDDAGAVKNETYQREYENQYRKEGERIEGGGYRPPEGQPPQGGMNMRPPESGMYQRPPEGGMFERPPEGYRPPEGTYQQPPSVNGGMYPAEPFRMESPPSSMGSMPPPSFESAPPPSSPPPSDSPPPPPPSGGSIFGAIIRFFFGPSLEN